MKNKKEFLELIERYESITIEEIEEAWKVGPVTTAQVLTGYGSPHTCTLCKKVNWCNDCQWYILTESRCFQINNGNTYDAIGKASNPKRLNQAFINRAKYMKEVLNNG